MVRGPLAMNGVVFMTGVMCVKYVLLLGCCLAASSLALAQPEPVETVAEEHDFHPAASRPDEIVVLATGSSLNIDRTGQAISVIGGSELRSIQGPDLTRALERSPGVTLTRNGGVGGFTGVRLRGADAEQLLVIVDGVRVADVAAPAGGFDFGNLLSGNVDRIELLRGSNSVIWGSQAIGGVLAVTTRAWDGLTASAEYGAQDSVFATAALGSKIGSLDLDLYGSFHDSGGISAAASGTEADGFRQWQFGGKAHVELTGSLALVASGRFADGRLDIDGYPPPDYSFADTAEYQTTREASGRVGLEYSGDALELKAGFALSDTHRELFDPGFGPLSYYTTDGRSERAELLGRLRIGDAVRLDFGADREWSSFLAGASGKASLTSGHALLSFDHDRLSLAGGVRIDDHSSFGSDATLGANFTYRLPEDWRIRGSYGEGFKAPTLFQLLSDYGNSALVPERSRSYDIGIEKGDRNARFHAALSLFRRDSRDLIDFVSCFEVTTGICANRPYGTYDNLGRARAEGFELEVDGRPVDSLQFHAAYSYVKAFNRTPGHANQGKALARRPRHAMTLAADLTTPLHDLALGADLRVVGSSFDDAGNFTRLDSYALVTLRASLPLGERFELYGRIENLTGERYETAAGYGTPGRSAYVGARARF